MSVYIVKAQKTKLRGNLSTSATQVVLDNLIDSKGDAIAMASFGEWFVLVVKQGTKIEMIKCDGLTQNGNGSATCDVATNGRGLSPVYPYTGSASGEDFLSGAEVIITNDPVTVMYYMLSNDNVWTGLNQFSQAPNIMSNAVVSTGAVRKSQLDSALLGVATSVSVVVEGIAGETISDGQLIYFDFTADAWLKCDADTASTVNNVLLGIAQGSGTIGNQISNGVLLRGTDDAQSGMTAGDIMYASNTAGSISASTGTTPVAVGIAKNATQLYFEPRFNTGLSTNQINAINGANSPSGSNVFLTANDASATPSANIIPKADANGTLNSFVTGMLSGYQALESITAGQAVSLYPIQSDGGVKIDQVLTGSTNTGQVVNVGNNSNRGVLVFCVASNNTGVTPTATFGGNSMTQLAGQTSNGGGFAFYIHAPNTGNQSLVLSTNCHWVLYSLYNVAQSTATENVAINNDNGSQTLTTTTTTDGVMHFNSLSTGNGSASGYGLSGQGIYAGTTGINDGSGHVNCGNAGQVYPNGKDVACTSSAGGGFAYVRIRVSVKPYTAPTYAGVMKSYAGSNSTTAPSQYANKYTHFLGIATNTVTSGQTCNVQHTGIVSGLSGLTPMETYYLSDTSGSISKTAGTNSRKIGFALSTTTLLLKNDNV